jgi:hypothetical protein
MLFAAACPTFLTVRSWQPLTERAGRTGSDAFFGDEIHHRYAKSERDSEGKPLARPLCHGASQRLHMIRLESQLSQRQGDALTRLLLRLMRRNNTHTS